jgi:hypothetical protein
VSYFASPSELRSLGRVKGNLTQYDAPDPYTTFHVSLADEDKGRCSRICRQPVKKTALLTGSSLACALVARKGRILVRSIKTLAATLIGLAVVVGVYDQLGPRRLAKRVDELEQEKTRLIDYIKRLGASRRVAQVEVVHQCLDYDGRIANRIHWQEMAPNGLAGRFVELKTVGLLAYFEAFVVKFEHELVGTGDPERGASLSIFRRVFGDQQAPESVAMLDQEPPQTGARGAQDPTGRSSTQAFEAREAALWQRFWDLIENPELRKRFGVRVAQIEAPAVPLQDGQLWEITLDAAGGLNLKLVRSGSKFIPPWCEDGRGTVAHRTP